MDAIVQYLMSNELRAISLLGGIILLILGVWTERRGSPGGAIIFIIVGIFLIIWSIGFLPSSQQFPPQVSPTNMPSTATTITSVPAIAQPSPLFDWELTVPGHETNTVFTASISGKHRIEIARGAYSPTPSEDYPGPKGWMTTLYIYLNRSSEWGLRPESGLVGPVNPDLEIGNGELRPSKEEAKAFVIGWSSVVDLQAGDELTFVPIDERGFYDKPANNRGEVVLIISLIP